MSWPFERFWALVRKELRQIRRDRRLVMSLIVPPALQILLFGFALDSEVRNMRLGVVDDSRTMESREFVSTLTENRTFRLAGTYPTVGALERALSSGRLDVGVVIPYDFARLRARGRQVTVQVLLNAVNANTAQIAQAHVDGALAWIAMRQAPGPGQARMAAGAAGVTATGSGASPSARVPAAGTGASASRATGSGTGPSSAASATGSGASLSASAPTTGRATNLSSATGSDAGVSTSAPTGESDAAGLTGAGATPGVDDVQAAAARRRAPRVDLRAAFLYNPGLVNAWFIVTGVFGTLIILNGSLVSAATMIREKESGTVEQLLMTPASALEVVAAKIIPLFALLMAMVGFVLLLARLVFDVPFRGSLLLVVLACACCVLTGIGVGTFVSTLARSANQTQLISFFVNPPLAMLSGALTPIEAMPNWVRPFTYVNPIAHFSAISRSVLIKGAGIDVVWVHVLALAALSIALVGVSAWRFRRQLS